jgi:Tfp pilus assembly protein PilV
MNFRNNTQARRSRSSAGHSSEQGFTLLEVAVSLVIMMIIGLGAASLFAYATNANSGATDRELAMAVAQKRMEWLRSIPFSAPNRNLAYSYPNGGLGATAGTTETETSSGRTYRIVTTIVNTSVVPAGLPDAGQPTVKTITIIVTPQGAGLALGAVALSSQRTTLVPGTY